MNTVVEDAGVILQDWHSHPKKMFADTYEKL